MQDLLDFEPVAVVIKPPGQGRQGRVLLPALKKFKGHSAAVTVVLMLSGCCMRLLL